MKHLSVDEIIAFVSLTELTDEAIQFSAYVNGHIRQCERCLELVRAFQMIYDEFTKLHTSRDFKAYIRSAAAQEKLKNETAQEIDFTADAFGG